MSYRRFVALGDSLTQGAGDSYPDGSLRGFADLLAAGLVRTEDHAVTYANLARPSVRVAEIYRDQVEQARRCGPDLVSVVAGLNDVLAVRLDPVVLATELDALFAVLRKGLPRATILTAALPDVGAVSGIARLLRSRVRTLNLATCAAAQRYDLVVVDLGQQAPLRREDLALDRVHPSATGHLRFAQAFGAAIGTTVDTPTFMAESSLLPGVRRLCRTVAVTPRFLTRRLARDRLIAAQPAKRPDLLPI